MLWLLVAVACVLTGALILVWAAQPAQVTCRLCHTITAHPSAANTSCPPCRLSYWKGEGTWTG